MFALDRSGFRTVEALLAVVVLLVAVTALTSLTSPLEVAPVWFSLVVPAVLGVVALLAAAGDGLRIDSVVVGTLAVLTLSMALWSGYTLYAVETGGVFFGGVFTLAVATALAVAVLLRVLVSRFVPVAFWSVSEA